jgi:hypothetical protein
LLIGADQRHDVPASSRLGHILEARMLLER